MSMYLIGGLAVGSLALIVYAMWPKGAEEDKTIQRRIKGDRNASDAASSLRPPEESVAKRVLKSVAPIALRPVMITNPEQMSKLRMKLATAGIRSESATTTFLASKTITALVVGALGGVYAWTTGDTLGHGSGLTLFCCGIGFMGPNIWLSLAASRRSDRIRMGLADTLDMLVISVEAGLGLDAAFQRVGDEMRPVHPDLAEELQLVTLESQMGIPRSEALVNMVERSGLAEMKSLVAIINQAERFGTSIAKALHNQSEALRVKRRQAAEERAQSTTVKLMAPLILFIFPAILVVLAGPAALMMMETLGNTSALG